MSANIYDGKALVAKMSARIKREAERLRRQRHLEVGLGILLVTGDQVSMAEAGKIATIAKESGVKVHMESVAQRNIERKFYPALEEYATSPFVQGIYIQLPLPTEIVPLSEVMRRLPPEKDVAGLHFVNRGMSTYPPHQVEATVHPPEMLAVAAALKECKIDLKGGKVVLIGSNATIGAVKLLAAYLYGRGCSVRLLHYSDIPAVSTSKTAQRLKSVEEPGGEQPYIVNPDGEAVITWTNRPGWLSRANLKPKSIVVDMGYRFAHGRISGDCDFPSVAQTAASVTPVPGGIRSIVHVMVLQNLMELIYRQTGEVEQKARESIERRFNSKRSAPSRRLKGG